jgi:hypothetical protein
LFADPAAPSVLQRALNAPLQDKEVQEQLASLPTGKARGPDGWANEFLKAAFSTDNVGLLTSLFERVRADECVPAEWQESIIAPLPKCDDTTLTGNFRGISLMSCVAKLFGRVVNARLARFLDAVKGIMPEQGGFQATRECAEQGYGLFETLRRRKAANLQSFVCFIDMKKAYDRVWRGALWVKLHKLGIRGSTLRLLRNWYSRVVSAVRVNDSVTDWFDIELGVKQGCVLSPLLFNVFINDILEDIKADGCGIHIPGVRRTPFARATLTGLLWADDLAVIAESEEGLRSMLDSITKWSDRNKMEVNAAKCAVLRFGCGPAPEWDAQLARHVVWQELSRKHREGGPSPPKEFGSPFRLQGGEVPPSRSYKYLGTIFSDSLSFGLELQEREKKVRGAIYANEAIWRSHRLPIKLRIRAFNAKILPVALWGAELWYSSADDIRRLGTVVESGYRMILGANKSVARTGLLWELGVLPLRVQAEKKRVNFTLKLRLRKEGDFDLWALAVFRQQPPSGRSWSWKRHSVFVAKEMGLDVKTVALLNGDGELSTEERKLLTNAKESLGERAEARGKEVMMAEARKRSTLDNLVALRSCEKYEQAEYLNAAENPAAWRAWFRLRTGSLPLNRKVSKFDPDTPAGCLACASFTEEKVEFLSAKEGVEHFLVCPALREARGPAWRAFYTAHQATSTDTPFSSTLLGVQQSTSTALQLLPVHPTSRAAPFFPPFPLASRMHDLAISWKLRCTLNAKGLSLLRAMPVDPLAAAAAAAANATTSKRKQKEKKKAKTAKTAKKAKKATKATKTKKAKKAKKAKHKNKKAIVGESSSVVVSAPPPRHDSPPPPPPGVEATEFA